MNVYDFDHTIYGGDSSIDFALHHIVHHPVSFCFLPVLFFAGCAAKMGLLSSKKSKELFFSFLRIAPASTEDVNAFWLLHRKKIKAWYLEQQQPDDLIVSASPAFLLSPFMNEMGKELIATEMSPASGRIRGENCKGINKVGMILERKGEVRIHSFYSDSLSDTPLAEMAEKAYLVFNGKRDKTEFRPWPLEKTFSRVRQKT